MVERKVMGPKGVVGSSAKTCGAYVLSQIDEGGDEMRANLGEEFVHLAARTVLDFALPAVVFVAEEIVPQERVVDEALKDDV